MSVEFMGSPPNKNFYKKWAKIDTTVDINHQLIITGLSFTPSYYFAYQTDPTNGIRLQATDSRNNDMPGGQGQHATAYPSGTLSAVSSGALWNASGFTQGFSPQVTSAQGTIRVWVFE